jgi:hypothetical protein
MHPGCHKVTKIIENIFETISIFFAIFLTFIRLTTIIVIIAFFRTPTNKMGAYLSDYTPLEAPMIPPLLMYCIKAIEDRGINEAGIWRVGGSEKDSKELLEKLTQGKGATPSLNKYDVHAITSCVKKFLRSLKEPVIPLTSWQDFVQTAEAGDEAGLIQAISEVKIFTIVTTKISSGQFRQKIF